MKKSGPEKPIEEASKPVEIPCAKCQHLNPRGSNVCTECGAHLHVVCHHCGHRNHRAQSQCFECGHKLHRAWSKRVSRTLFGKRNKLSKLSLAQVILLIMMILIGFIAVVYFSNVQLPSPEH